MVMIGLVIPLFQQDVATFGNVLVFSHVHEFPQVQSWKCLVFSPALEDLWVDIQS